MQILLYIYIHLRLIWAVEKNKSKSSDIRSKNVRVSQHTHFARLLENWQDYLKSQRRLQHQLQTYIHITTPSDDLETIIKNQSSSSSENYSFYLPFLQIAQLRPASIVQCRFTDLRRWRRRIENQAHTVNCKCNKNFKIRKLCQTQALKTFTTNKAHLTVGIDYCCRCSEMELLHNCWFFYYHHGIQSKSQHSCITCGGKKKSSKSGEESPSVSSHISESTVNEFLRSAFTLVSSSSDIVNLLKEHTLSTIKTSLLHSVSFVQ